MIFSAHARAIRGVALAISVAVALAPVLLAPNEVAPTRLASAVNVAAPAAVPTAASGISIELAWERTLSKKKPVWFSSPGVATLDGKGASVIVGDTAGKVWAFHTSDGSRVAGWPYSTKGVRVMSTPAVSGTGKKTRVFVGVGSSAAPTKGGYLALNYKGDKAWYHSPYLLPGNKGGKRGVMSSMAVGNIRTGSDVIGGAMGQMQSAFTAKKGKTLAGFPWLMADTNFSTPALANVFGKKRDYIFEGGDSTAGSSSVSTYKSGGHIRILKPTGNLRESWPDRGLKCEATTNQVVQSSPAVGKFLAHGRLGVVTGTGIFYKHRSDTNRIIAINGSCKRIWSKKLDGATRPSPALVDLTGNGTLEVVTMSEKGTVYALSGPSGKKIWTRKLGHGTDGSVTTFQAPGADFQYVLAPAGQGVYLLDGRDGSIVKRISNFRLRSSATVTADPDGSIGITVAGATTVKHKSIGIIQHFRVVGSSVTTVQTKGAWPMFHHDPQLTGYAK